MVPFLHSIGYALIAVLSVGLLGSRFSSYKFLIELQEGQKLTQKLIDAELRATERRTRFTSFLVGLIVLLVTL